MNRAFISKLNPAIFWPPFLLLLCSSLFSLLFPNVFSSWMNAANDWILQTFGWLFSYTSFCMVVLCLILWVSPLGKTKIGGPNAVPQLSKWRWFGIVLCTSVAVGILFWGTAEPLYHISSPPEGLSQLNKKELVPFAMSTMFLHWSFTPFAIYCIPAVLFALAFYNRGLSFSLDSMLYPIIQNKSKLFSELVNVLCLFALVSGMAASLGAGLISLTGGLGQFTDIDYGTFWLGIVATIVVGTFTISAASGLLKGIKWLSSINMLVFIVLTASIFVFGPTISIVENTGLGLLSFVRNFIPHSLSIGDFSDQSWTNNWTTFYWANWMAWAPITALFLGRISYGYTVRQFLMYNWIFPSVFSIVWMGVFSGTVLHQANSGVNHLGVLKTEGAQEIIYNMVREFPWPEGFIGLFILTMFISYVTAADSNTMAMSALSSKGISADNPDPPVYVKYIWGGLVGLVAWVMVSFAGIDGVKMLSNLGGLPALFLLIACTIALAKLVYESWKNSRIYK